MSMDRHTETNSQVWLLGHRPQLDGVRAMAVLLVLIAHAKLLKYVGTGGAVGVAVFFTLSGFLITTLLLEERQVFGRINVPSFYKRRFLRLAPAMVTCVVLGSLVLLIHGYVFPDLKLVIGTLTYTSNWVMITPLPRITTLGHTWSLAVEEQFYLIWPLIVILTARVAKRRMIAALGVVCAAVLVWRFVLYDGGAGDLRVYFGLDTRADSLMYGAIVAYALHQSRVRPDIPRWLVLVGLAFVGSGCFLPTRLPNDIQVRIMPTLAGIGTAIVIYAIAQNRGFTPFGWRWVQWIGKRSYGLYLYQSPVNVFFQLTFGHAKWVQSLVFAGTFAVAALSYRYIEKPFLRIKDRDAKSQRGLARSLRAGRPAPKQDSPEPKQDSPEPKQDSPQPKQTAAPDRL